ncbi:MAG: hypothetical protein ACOCWO_06040, partial [Candidatus Muiribacteriaceae bacterium]
MKSKKILTVFFIILISLIVFEGILRMMGTFYTRSEDVEFPEKDVRILCAGDSITYGEGVAEINSFPVLLEEKLNKVNDK